MDIVPNTGRSPDGAGPGATSAARRPDRPRRRAPAAHGTGNPSRRPQKLIVGFQRAPPFGRRRHPFWRTGAAVSAALFGYQGSGRPLPVDIAVRHPAPACCPGSVRRRRCRRAAGRLPESLPAGRNDAELAHAVLQGRARDAEQAGGAVRPGDASLDQGQGLFDMALFHLA